MLKNTLWKEDDVIVFQSKMALREITRRNTWQPVKPGEIYQNWETSGGNGSVDRSFFTFFPDCWGTLLTDIILISQQKDETQSW